MITIAIQLEEEQANQLATIARQKQMTVEELATEQVLDLLAKPAPTFEEASRYVLEKNAELFRRLSQRSIWKP